MKTSHRGRPRLDMDLASILKAVRRHGQVVAAAQELGGSDAYIHVRLKQAALTLRQVLEAERVEDLISGGA